MATSDLDAAHAAEQRLIRSALAGDGRAFRDLVEPHLAMLHRVAARVSGDRQLAEDAVQETLALSYQRLPSYRHETPFKAFLAAIAATQAHTLARSERRRKGRERSADAPESPGNPEEIARAAATADAVREVLQQLPKKRREAALLRLDAGLSYREIGDALGSSEGSARVLVHMALKELRQRLSHLLEPGS
jgi:RNA polymerase sigma-70 factor (ECF subfamily)